MPGFTLAPGAGSGVAEGWAVAVGASVGDASDVGPSDAGEGAWPTATDGVDAAAEAGAEPLGLGWFVTVVEAAGTDPQPSKETEMTIVAMAHRTRLNRKRFNRQSPKRVVCAAQQPWVLDRAAPGTQVISGLVRYANKQAPVLYSALV
jgi:hypothetical protein